MHVILHYFENEWGQGLVEYAVLLSAVALAAVISLQILGINTYDLYEKVKMP